MTNPFFSAWTTPYETPPFDLIETSDFKPAFDEALKLASRRDRGDRQHADAPSFENTIGALERSRQAAAPRRHGVRPALLGRHH